MDRLYLSKDRGATWEPVEASGTGFTMSAITFSDAQHGWAVGGNGLILRTKDGGTTWELLKPPGRINSGERQPDLHAVHFIDANVGYIAGNRQTASKTSDEVWGDVEVLCTTDGGENWRSCYQKNEPLTAFQITSNARSTFVVFGDRAIRTDDQGETWQEVSTSAKHISWIAFSADGTGWLVGSHGVFQQSIDGGKTWQEPASLPAEFANRDWEAIAFNSRGMGLAVGENSSLALTTERQDMGTTNVDQVGPSSRDSHARLSRRNLGRTECILDRPFTTNTHSSMKRVVLRFAASSLCDSPLLRRKASNLLTEDWSDLDSSSLRRATSKCRPSIITVDVDLLTATTVIALLTCFVVPCHWSNALTSGVIGN
jgi:photosystem II stability/assembly factor-like uncharacterized protein